MTAIGIIILVVSWLALFAASIWLLVIAFRVSVGWGLASLFIPFAGFVFPFLHWEKGGKPFIALLCCLPPAIVGFILIILGQVPASNGRSGTNTEFVSREEPQLDESSTNAPVALPGASSVADKEIARGDIYAPISPMTLLPALRYSAGSIILSDFRGNESGTRFNDRAPSGGILIGLRIGVDEQLGHILNIRPIFQVANRCTYGDIHGPTGGQPQEIVAKPGFAIGGLLITTTIPIHSVQAIFLRINNLGQLDPEDRYDSNIVGREGGRKRRIFAEGRPIAEVSGWTRDKLQAIGLGAIGSTIGDEVEIAQSTQQQRTPISNPFADTTPKSRPTNEPDAPLGELLEKPLTDEPSTESNPPLENNSDPQPDHEPDSEPNVTAEEPFRNWSSAGGSFSVTAKFKAIDGKKVLLENREGKTVLVAVDKLCQSDQDYLKSRQVNSRQVK